MVPHPYFRMRTPVKMTAPVSLSSDSHHLKGIETFRDEEGDRRDCSVTKTGPLGRMSNRNRLLSQTLIGPRRGEPCQQKPRLLHTQPARFSQGDWLTRQVSRIVAWLCCFLMKYAPTLEQSYRKHGDRPDLPISASRQIVLSSRGWCLPPRACTDLDHAQEVLNAFVSSAGFPST